MQNVPLWCVMSSKDYWSEDEFADLAKRHGLMPLGA
jgi:hypothetical protein